MKYIISVDLGSSNIKSIVLKIENDVITVVGKDKFPISGFDANAFFTFNDLLNKIYKKYNLKKIDIEKIIWTGTGSSFIDTKKLDNSLIDVDGIIIINEFDAIGYGGVLLSRVEEGIVVSIGTGTAIVYSNLEKSIHIGGTGLGGGAFVGLGVRFLENESCRNFKKIVDFAKSGNTKNVDLTIGDINSGAIDNMTKDVTAANFAAINKTSTDADYVAGIANMILENICLIAHYLKINVIKENNLDDLPIIFIGTMPMEDYIKNIIMSISNFTKDEYKFVDNSDFAIAIGAYEYYMLRERKVI